MADITVSYKGNTIAEVSASGTTTLGTSGKYCEDDISIAYTKPSVVAVEVPFTTSPGFWKDNGLIQNPSSSAEVYTSNIPCSPNDRFALDFVADSSKSMWCAYAAFDENGTFLSRIVLGSPTSAEWFVGAIVPSDAYAVSFTYRTYQDTVSLHIYKLIGE